MRFLFKHYRFQCEDQSGLCTLGLQVRDLILKLFLLGCWRFSNVYRPAGTSVAAQSSTLLFAGNMRLCTCLVKLSLKV